MKFFFPALLLGSCLLLGGCGGATTASTQRTDGATFALSPGQNATLTLTSQGSIVTGTLSVPSSATVTSTASGALSFALPRGNYGLNGTLANGGTFGTNGNVPTISTFSVFGQLGSGATSGSFSLVINNQKVSGVLTRQ